MAERRIGLIPYAFTTQRGDQEHCAIFVTDQRTILVFSHARKGLKEGLRLMYGKEADEPIEPPRQLDFRKAGIDEIAAVNGNISVLHSSIEKFSCGKGVGGYGLWTIYKNEKGKKQFLMADFVPHPELMKRLRAEGKSPKEIKKEYAERCQMVFKKALPVNVAQEGEW